MDHKFRHVTHIKLYSELQKEHLSYLHQVSTQVLVDFCKLSIDYLNNGVNLKKYSMAAERLDMSPTVVQNIVNALVHVLVEGSRYNLSESDLKSSLRLVGFNQEHQGVLLKLYQTKKAELSEALYLLQQKDPKYQNLSWRFEVQIASRHSADEIKPVISMDFTLMTPKDYEQNKSSDHSKPVGNAENKSVNSLEINVPIHEADATSQCQNTISHVFLQCDLPNLLNMTNKLEQALKESKSQHVRKIQRVLH